MALTEQAQQQEIDGIKEEVKAVRKRLATEIELLTSIAVENRLEQDARVAAIQTLTGLNHLDIDCLRILGQLSENATGKQLQVVTNELARLQAEIRQASEFTQ